MKKFIVVVTGMLALMSAGPLMARMAAALSDADIADLAAFFAAQSGK